MKWRNRIFWLRILIMVLVIVGSYLAYAFIYRGRNEPPTKRKTTNQEAAYYTLRGQIQMLSQKEELMAFAFEDRKKEREYGTYIIPGLKATRTLLTSEGDMPAMCMYHYDTAGPGSNRGLCFCKCLLSCEKA